MVAPFPKVEALISKLILREGGYVNRSEDAGGPTNWGITQNTLSEWRGYKASAEEVAMMPIEVAKQIYRKRYFYDPGFDAITDPELQEFMFDFGVNSGPGSAVRAMQTSLLGMGLDPKGIDGDLGNNTRKALAVCTNIPELYYRIKSERWELLLRYIGRDHRQAIFAAGWANRLDELNDD